MNTTDNSISFSIANNPILVIDENGIFYKGQRIEVMALMKHEATKP